jgi:hypothetical protein
MREFQDYTDEEVLALTDDDVKGILDLQCAIEGVKLLELPEYVEEKDVPRDKAVWEIAGIYFERKEDAENVLAILNDVPLLNIDYDFSYEHKYAKSMLNDRCPMMSEVRVFSEGQYHKLKEELKIVKAKKEVYSKLKKEYDEARRQREEIAEPIWERIHNLRREQRRLQDMREEFARYLDLADQSETIAMNFLRRAHNIPNELAEELVPGYFGTEGADPKTVEEEEEE